MTRTQERRSYLAIGQIVGPHGIRGEVKVVSLTDFPERFKASARVYLGAETGETDAMMAEIAAVRQHQDRWLVLFSHVKDRTAAETLRDQYILIPEEDVMPLGEHENYVHDLIGLHVLTADGQSLGQVVEILFTPANDVYVIRSKQGETLIPATREVILSVDLPERRMTVALPEGLLAPVDEDDEAEDN